MILEFASCIVLAVVLLALVPASPNEGRSKTEVTNSRAEEIVVDYPRYAVERSG